jgi:hypothetical protein
MNAYDSGNLLPVGVAGAAEGGGIGQGEAGWSWT